MRRQRQNLMLNLKLIHPHARLWIITTIILGLILVLKTPTGQQFVSPPKGKIIAYYQNDYQRYAIDRLMKQGDLEQYTCLYELWTEESNWRPQAKNKSSHALGIAQLMPRTWKILKIKPTSNGYRQVDAGLAYIDRHYGKGAICKAYAHHLAKGWY
jgi:hypothetical protein